MTVEELYSETKACMFEKLTSTSYDTNILPITRKILAEIFEENNMLRMKRGLLPLLEIPTVSTRNDDLTEKGILEEYQHAMVKGLDANFSIDDDLNKFAIFNTEYNNARVALQVMVSQDKVKELTARAIANAL